MTEEMLLLEEEYEAQLNMRHVANLLGDHSKALRHDYAAAVLSRLIAFAKAADGNQGATPSSGHDHGSAAPK